MNDVIRKRAAIWNCRLQQCMNAQKLTQASLAKAINQKFGTSYQQKDVYRWLHVGEISQQNKSGELGFPKYEAMSMIADFFEKDVGFFVGETDYDTFALDKASTYMGINQTAIKSLRSLTSDNWLLNLDGISAPVAQSVLNKLFSTKGFLFFIKSLCDLDKIYSTASEEKEKLWKSVIAHVDPNLILDAIEYEHILQYDENSNSPPSLELLEAIHLVNDTMDKFHAISEQKEYSEDVFRYRLQQAFYKLIDELYPRDNDKFSFS